MTLTHVPVTIPDDDAISAESTLIIHRPRRRRWWPALIAAAVVVALGAVGLGQAKSPALRFDGTPAVWRLAPGDATSMRHVDNALGSEVTVGFERAGAFSAELALDGREAVDEAADTGHELGDLVTESGEAVGQPVGARGQSVEVIGAVFDQYRCIV